MTADEIVLRVVRGEAPMSALRAAGVTISAAGVVRPKSPVEPVSPSLADLTAGFRKHTGRKSLAKWALFVIRAGFIDIHPEANSTEWDAMLGALWDASGSVD